MARTALRSSSPGIGEIRQREIRRLLIHRYGPVLPDDDAGREDLRVMVLHLAHLRRGAERVSHFVDVFAPWLTNPERAELTAEVSRMRAPRFTADGLARRLGVTLAERTALRLTTIGAIDCSKRERAKRRRALARKRQERRRKKLGVRSRTEFLAGTLTKGAQPWVAEGVSRRTWYRRMAGK